MAGLCFAYTHGQIVFIYFICMACICIKYILCLYFGIEFLDLEFKYILELKYSSFLN